MCERGVTPLFFKTVIHDAKLSKKICFYQNYPTFMKSQIHH